MKYYVLYFDEQSVSGLSHKLAITPLLAALCVPLYVVGGGISYFILTPVVFRRIWKEAVCLADDSFSCRLFQSVPGISKRRVQQASRVITGSLPISY